MSGSALGPEGAEARPVVGSPPASPGRLAILRLDTRLRDGTPVIIRPVTPAHRELLREGFARLSEESRYRRFNTGITQLSDQQLDALTDLDHRDRFAWGATLADQPDVGIGVARYVRLGEEPDVAEVAVTVIDAYQRRGLGTMLVSMLGVTARAAGITSFRAYVLPENRAIRQLIRRFRARIDADPSGLLRAEIPLAPVHT